MPKISEQTFCGENIFVSENDYIYDDLLKMMNEFFKYNIVGLYKNVVVTKVICSENTICSELLTCSDK